MRLWAVMRVRYVGEDEEGNDVFSVPVAVLFRKTEDEADYFAELFEEQSQEDQVPYAYYVQGA
jgi:hypothetical protein